MIDRNVILNLATVSGDINEYLLSLYNIPVQKKLRNIVEIGAGVSTFALVAAANKIEGHVTSMDIVGSDALNRVPNGEFLMQGENRFTMIKGSSLELPIIEDIDFLFLDSEHTYELTKAEIARWFPQVKDFGIIAMHDTAHEAGQQVQCRQALDEFLASVEGRHYQVIHLLDTKIIGLSILVKT